MNDFLGIELRDIIAFNKTFTINNTIDDRHENEINRDALESWAEERPPECFSKWAMLYYYRNYDEFPLRTGIACIGGIEPGSSHSVCMNVRIFVIKNTPDTTIIKLLLTFDKCGTPLHQNYMIFVNSIDEMYSALNHFPLTDNPDNYWLKLIIHDNILKFQKYPSVITYHHSDWEFDYMLIQRYVKIYNQFVTPKLLRVMPRLGRGYIRQKKKTKRTRKQKIKIL